MSVKIKLCPVCYCDLSQVKVERLEHKNVFGMTKLKRCPKCKTIIDFSENCPYVRCSKCHRLFVTILDYEIHFPCKKPSIMKILEDKNV